MKIIAINAAVGSSFEDIISKGANIAEPTSAQKHELVSSDAEDDSNGILQVETATAAGTIAGILQQETATAAGTIAGILQVETATVVGAIGEAGAGDAKVTITGALVDGTPLDVAVAVANSDTASQVAGKIRTALAIAAITDNYTVGGTGATVTLTTKAVAANDATLNIAIDNDTCTGLTAAPTSVNTTAGHAGSGDAEVIITSALLEDSPLTISVAVAVDDTASDWAEKVRDELNDTEEITDAFTVSGAGASIILTAKVAAANDSTLNISLDNDTCNGITTAASSANTTAGHAGTGNATIVITSALLSVSPLTVSVPVTIGDTPTLWAEKVRDHLSALPAITDYYTVGGTGTSIKLTTLVGHANDASLNISLDNGTCNGISTAASSANTTAGVLGTGAWTVIVNGIDENFKEREEIVYLQGVTPVLTENEYKWINQLSIKTAGSGGKNAGTITATAETDNTVTIQIEIGNNKSQQAVIMVPADKSANISYFNVSAANVTEGAVTTVEIQVKKNTEVWIPEFTIALTAADPTFIDNLGEFIDILKPGSLFKVAAKASAGSSSVLVNFNISFI